MSMNVAASSATATQEDEGSAKKAPKARKASNGAGAEDAGAAMAGHLKYSVAPTKGEVSMRDAYMAASYAMRDRLIGNWVTTQERVKAQGLKEVSYLSMEFLMGRALQNAVFCLGVQAEWSKALLDMGYKLEEVAEEEKNHALGNGGLGRLAACFLDSLASLDYPSWGYGIRYEFGMFKQMLRDGYQLEVPDVWLENGNPWEVRRGDVVYKVSFGGEVVNGKWSPAETVEAVAYDNPIPGFQTDHVATLRLWEARPTYDDQFDLQLFNRGKHLKAAEARSNAELIHSVLYPDDSTKEGKDLRLKQQFFFTSASLQDVLARYIARHGSKDWSKLPECAAVQMNDTHPTIAVAELMRLLCDEYGVAWGAAWDIVNKTLHYTNHTVMPEALETWGCDLISKLLPRHMDIIERIDAEFLEAVRREYPGEEEKHGRMAIIERGPAPPPPHTSGSDDSSDSDDDRDSAPAEGTIIPLKVRMANMAVIGSKAVNGVAAIHTEIIKELTFADFYGLYPEKFNNKTNGVTPRRWMGVCNPDLASLLDAELGTSDWVRNTDLLRPLAARAGEPALQSKFAAVKLANKKRLAAYLEKTVGVKVSTDALFDVQIKRIHEYKRQLMNILSVIYRYDCIRKMSPEEKKNVTPRVVVIGGKAAAAYDQAKRIIKLITAVADKVNNDPKVGDLLKVAFVPDYNVSVAEVLIPGSELSQHISTAGTEASGTSNMKFMMNGCLIIGTLDGANIEIAEEAGLDNIFIFGLEKDDIEPLRRERAKLSEDGKDFNVFEERDPRFVRALELIRDGEFGVPGAAQGDYFEPIIGSLGGWGFGRGDWFCVGDDFASYLDAQERVDAAYKDQAGRNKSSIINIANSGKFNSDRTINQYAEMWNIKAVKRS